MAIAGNDCMFKVSTEELAHTYASFINIFRIVGLKLGVFVMTVLKRVLRRARFNGVIIIKGA